MEKITITGLSVDTLIGVYDWERTQNTTLKLDITLHADLGRAMESDDVQDTIDYAAVAEHIQKLAGESQFELLEAFGNAIMKSVLATFSASSIELTVSKPSILKDADNVAVSMELSRR
ncbi:dihydroneopterin aldolase [Alteromonas sp. H39]|uniref:dihydroneopterin aldolase n=1 Tax=Alteromonas sp. H39 TaxID=3389876 RepID=UPI0039E053DB